MPDSEWDRDQVVYRVPTAVALRGVGVGAALLGLCVLSASVLRAAQPARSIVVGVGLVLAFTAVFGAVVLFVGLSRLFGLGARLVLDEDGFRNRTGPGAGVRKALWREVRRVQADGSVVSVDLTAGRHSLIRTTALDVHPRELAQELRRRLRRPSERSSR